MTSCCRRTCRDWSGSHCKQVLQGNTPARHSIKTEGNKINLMLTRHLVRGRQWTTWSTSNTQRLRCTGIRVSVMACRLDGSTRKARRKGPAGPGSGRGLHSTVGVCLNCNRLAGSHISMVGRKEDIGPEQIARQQLARRSKNGMVSRGTGMEMP